MGYRSLRECVADLERTGQLVRIEQEIDPYLEMAEIQRRVYQAAARRCYFARVKGCRFPMVSNLFGTLERTRFLFRDTLERGAASGRAEDRSGGVLEASVALPRRAAHLWHLRPKFVRGGPVLAHQTTYRSLPQLQCWPRDGGAFITLPQVYTEDADRPGWRHSNLGMYRVQLSGNEYQPDREVGLHYQIHRGIGVHHAAALRRGVPFRVNIFVGGPPAHDAGRRDAAAGRDARAGLRRGARRPARAAGLVRTAGRPTCPDRRPRPTSASAAPSIRTAAAGRTVRRSSRLLQPGA